MKIIKIDLSNPTTDDLYITDDDILCQIEFFTNSSLTKEEKELIRQKIPRQCNNGTIYIQFLALTYKFTFSQQTQTISATLAYGMN